MRGCSREEERLFLAAMLFEQKNCSLNTKMYFLVCIELGGPGLKQLTATGKWKNEGKFSFGSVFVPVCNCFLWDCNLYTEILLQVETI